jgi:hypothetical protein
VAGFPADAARALRLSRALHELASDPIERAIAGELVGLLEILQGGAELADLGLERARRRSKNAT